MKKSISVILKILISIFFIALLLWLMKDSIRQILVMLKAAKIWLVFLAFLIYFINVFIASYRLKKVMVVQDIRLPLKDVIRLTLVGLFFNNFMPTAVGGDVVKAYYTAKSTDKKLASFTAVFMDRLMGLLSFVTLATLALVFYGRYIEDKVIILAVFSMFIISLLGLIVLLNKNVAKKLRFILTTLRFVKLDTNLRKIYESIANYRRHKTVVIQAFCISLISQVVAVFIVYILAKSLSLNIPLIVLFMVVPLIATVSMLPSLNGLGIREGAYVYFLAGIVGSEQAFALSLLWLGSSLAISLLGGIVYLFRGQLLPRNAGRIEEAKND